MPGLSPSEEQIKDAIESYLAKKISTQPHAPEAAQNVYYPKILKWKKYFEEAKQMWPDHDVTGNEIVLNYYDMLMALGQSAKMYGDANHMPSYDQITKMVIEQKYRNPPEVKEYKEDLETKETSQPTPKKTTKHPTYEDNLDNAEEELKKHNEETEKFHKMAQEPKKDESEDRD